MSTETTTPKKSILTRAMEAVRDQENGEVTEESTTEPKFAYKRLAIGTGAVIGTAAVLTIALKLFTGQQVEDETSEEANPTD